MKFTLKNKQVILPPLQAFVFYPQKRGQEELYQPPFIGGYFSGYGQAGEQGRFPAVDQEAVLGQEQTMAVNKARFFIHRGRADPVFGEYSASAD